MGHPHSPGKGSGLTPAPPSGYSEAMDPIVLYSTALLLGSVHALEADHLSAVTAFAVRNPRARHALGFGVRWALGHGAAVLIIGSAIILLQRQIPDGVTHVIERIVGVVLLALGLWTVRGARELHAHTHTHRDGTTHTHVHSHARGKNHHHGHGITFVGLLHGAAGSASVVALLPVAGLTDRISGVLYLVLFAVGTIAGMALYALLAGVVVGRTAAVSLSWARSLCILAGCFTITVGLIWLLR